VVYDTQAAAATLPPALSASFNAWLDSVVTPDEQFTYEDLLDGNCVITRYIGTGGAIRVPAKLAGLNVVGIGDNCFANCVGVISIDLPNTVADVGILAFYWCVALASVNLGTGVESVGAAAFSGCTALTTVTFEDKLSSVGDNAFHDCTALETVYFLGDAPGTVGATVFSGGSSPSILCVTGMNGWGATFCGLDVEVLAAAPPAAYVAVPRMVRLGSIVTGVVADFRAAVLADADPTGASNSAAILASSLRHVAAIVWYVLAQECGEDPEPYRVAWQDSEIYLRQLLTSLRAGSALVGAVGTPAYVAGPGSNRERTGGGAVVAGEVISLSSYIDSEEGAGINYGS
ncbi:MAG: leucine-rich repeat domain-containing protein, partial [bacterium]